MSERGDGWVGREPKKSTIDSSFVGSFTARALEIDDAPEAARQEFWAKATDADLDEYANARAEFVGGVYSEFLKTATNKRDVARKALGVEDLSTFDRTMRELEDDQKNHEDLERTMGTGDPK